MSSRFGTRRALGARKGVASAVLSRFVVRLLGLGIVLLATRHMSLSDFATYSYVLALGDTCLAFVDSGISQLVARSLARGDVSVQEALRRSVLVQAATSGIAGSASLLIGLVSYGAAVSPGVAVAAGAAVALNGMVNLYADIIRAQGHAWPEALLQTVGALLLLVVGGVVLLLGGGLIGLLLTLVVKHAVVLCAMLAMLPLRPGLLWHPNIRSLLMSTARIAAAGTIITMLWRWGILLLPNVGSAREAANYAAANRVLDILITVGATIAFGVSPRLASITEGAPRRRLRQLLFAGGAILLLVGVAAGALLVPWADDVAAWVFGPNFRSAGPTLAVFLVGAPVLLLTSLMWGILVAVAERKGSGLVAVVGSVGLLVGAAVVVARPVAVLTAFVTTAVALLLLVVMGWVVWRVLGTDEAVISPARGAAHRDSSERH